MKFAIVLDRDEDGMWIAECPSIPGCVSQGKTREEALKNIQEAISLCLEVRAERGMPLTIETPLNYVSALPSAAFRRLKLALGQSLLVW
jgi:predicted RNase H-like HicB family nuclease